MNETTRNWLLINGYRVRKINPRIKGEWVFRWEVATCSTDDRKTKRFDTCDQAIDFAESLPAGEFKTARG